MNCAAGQHFTVTYGAGTGSPGSRRPPPRPSYTFATSVTLGTTKHKLSVPPVVVQPGPAADLVVSGLPSPGETGAPLPVTVTADDAFGNVATGYLGTVHFTSSDPGASLPGDYTFTPADSGTHAFANGVMFLHEGTQSVTATDTANPSVTGSDSVPVNGVLFVSLNGSDTNHGTQAQPLRTVSAAVSKAVVSSPPFAIDVAGGTYNEGGGVTVSSNITIEGGFDPSTWMHSGTETTTITGAPQAVYANAATGVLLEDLTLQGSAQPGSGQSSYGLRAINGSNVTLDYVAVSAGNGSVGQYGNFGTQGQSGQNGAFGGNGQSSGGCTSSFGAGGSGGAYVTLGGRGGDGGCSGGAGSSGASGQTAAGGGSGGAGGLGGAGDNQPQAAGGTGGRGANGANGSPAPAEPTRWPARAAPGRAASAAAAPPGSTAVAAAVAVAAEPSPPASCSSAPTTAVPAAAAAPAAERPDGGATGGGFGGGSFGDLPVELHRHAAGLLRRSPQGTAATAVPGAAAAPAARAAKADSAVPAATGQAPAATVAGAETAVVVAAAEAVLAARASGSSAAAHPPPPPTTSDTITFGTGGQGGAGRQQRRHHRAVRSAGPVRGDPALRSQPGHAYSPLVSTAGRHLDIGAATQMLWRAALSIRLTASGCLGRCAWRSPACPGGLVHTY